MTLPWPGPGPAPVGDPGPDPDAPPAATIVPYPDGPLIVRGDVVLQDLAGRRIDPGRDTIALCRCGRSTLKPFCDGSHAAVGFRAGGGDDRPGPEPAAQPPRQVCRDPQA